MGYAVTIDKLINCAESNLCFKPLEPRLEIPMYLVWKKGQIFSKAAELFLKIIKSMANQTGA